MFDVGRSMFDVHLLFVSTWMKLAVFLYQLVGKSASDGIPAPFLG
jgi:hypothetical protein